MKYKTLTEQISTTRAGFKLHRENFAEFKEGVLGRMKTTTASADDEEATLKRTQSRAETTAAYLPQPSRQLSGSASRTDEGLVPSGDDLVALNLIEDGQVRPLNPTFCIPCHRHSNPIHLNASIAIQEGIKMAVRRQAICCHKHFFLHS